MHLQNLKNRSGYAYILNIEKHVWLK